MKDWLYRDAKIRIIRGQSYEMGDFFDPLAGEEVLYRDASLEHLNPILR